MNRQGKLTPDKMGLTMPVDAPGFVDKPPFWRGVKSYMFNYETDADAAVAVLPEPLTLPEPAKVTLIFNNFEWSTGGPYFELLQGINAEFQGEACLYFTQLAVTEAVPLLAGREIYGFPKKVGHIEFVRQDDILAMYYERPKGTRICTGVFRQLLPVDPPPPPTTLKAVNLRVITSPEPGKKHSLCELILAELAMSKMEVWIGEGNCSYAGMSELDPWHKLRVVKHLDCSVTMCEATLGAARILKRW
jgi:acetoacetate decarboxylase